MKTKCCFCHQEIASDEYEQHVAQHVKRREDGQQRDHVTLPPEDRFTGDLHGVPRVYQHAVCGNATGMPEDIIRTYLVKPETYHSPFSFCTGCKDYVPYDSLFWVETGQRLDHYFEDLKRSVSSKMVNDRQRSSTPVISNRAILLVSVLVPLTALLVWFLRA